MKAHQRKIREEKALTEPTPDIDLSPSNASVIPISNTQAKEVILEYEWLKCMPTIAKYSFGLFYGDYLAGVVVYGSEYSENLGHWDKFGYTGKMLLLARGACVHWAPPYAGSFLIRRSMDLLPSHIEVVTATVDELAGEIGTIYQACGFDYVGSMRDNNPNCKGTERFGVVIDGKLYGSRAMRAKVGSQRKQDILNAFPDSDVQFVKQKAKSRYFAFRGSKKIQKEHRAAIAHITREYPKRD